ncbi:RTA1 domain-containing protein KNAG_0G00680 [Huiozyma naganishii CBS 8797]|uniref:Uncharacterized protein n=1 Tax=Huiozyma naganishii (strain ATCC MYA-139 / BCRC 22969 / CBS 8797 / KCTC 17520 / NBRC 10181 / NCYC 3082 / Yp74L-3) TaxID=1071383 RepID=J7S7R4_HUIN7|nr:hypothetical protein KNAG_0G00680 [Kazachstania naganishii CBS 8797]CCK71124.1 hypothetical protein KNAG_0G00680 [Kazachstania naganishii CBS 8797]
MGGYLGRSVSASKDGDLGSFIAQGVMLLISPTMFGVTIYMLYGRLAHLLFAERFLFFPARWRTLIFLMSDATSRILQGVGAGLMSQASSLNVGSDLVIVGLFVQIAFFGLLMINQCFLLSKLRKGDNRFPVRNRRWEVLLLVLFTCSFLIQLRFIVRVAGFLQGVSGVIESHEWFLYVFDSTPMFLLAACFLLVRNQYSIFKVQEDSIATQLEFHSDNPQSEQFDDEKIAV